MLLSITIRNPKNKKEKKSSNMTSISVSFEITNYRAYQIYTQFCLM